MKKGEYIFEIEMAETFHFYNTNHTTDLESSKNSKMES